MDIDKTENPIRFDSESTDSYPLIQKINSRPATTAINRSIDESFDYSTHAPDEVAPPTAPVRQVVEGPNTIQDNFSPLPYQAKIKKCGKCLNIFGWILVICGALNIVGNLFVMIFMGGNHQMSYRDIDGQKMTITIDGNTWFMFAFFKIVVGTLTLIQGKAIHKVFRPIMKEYKDAETGRTQGIMMTERKSKKMLQLKKQIRKLTCFTFFVGFLVICYYKNFQDEMIDSWIDQKYEYISMYNNSMNGTYSVEDMKKKFAHAYNPTKPKQQREMPDDIDFKPPTQERPNDQPEFSDFDPSKVRWDEKFDDAKKNINDMMNKTIHDFDDIWQKEFKGKPLIPDNKKEFNFTEFGETLFHHGQQHHGQQHGQQPQRRPSQNDDDEDNQGYSKHNSKSSWKKSNPYEDWLDDLPYTDKTVAAKQVKAVFTVIIAFSAIWSFISYLMWQGIQLCCISKAVKNQTILENKYMGPEIRQVQPTPRQVAATTTTNELPQPVIQYIAEPASANQVSSATGNIVTANQII